MVMKASLQALTEAAAGWDGIGLELHNAYSDIVGYENSGSKFGWYADRAGIPQQHDTFIAAMADALLAGEKVMNDVADALRDVAKDFGATDLEVKDTFHKLDGTPA